jgi:hypothetical protein
MNCRAVTLLLAAASPMLAGDVRAQERPVIVLTDTMEYCEQLQHRLLAHPPWPLEVTKLYNEGRMLCDHGEVRGGINRLRQALRMLNHHVPAQ